VTINNNRKSASNNSAVTLTDRFSAWVDRHLIPVLISPTLLLLIALVIFPTLYLLWLSLSKWDMSSGGPQLIGLGNYIKLFTNDDFFWKAVQRSVLFVIIGVLIEYILGLGIALLMLKPLRGIGLFRTLMTAPMAMTPIVTGMVWLILYNPNYGMVNYLLSFVGISGVEWISQPITALPALIIVDIWQWTPFMFLVLTAGLLSIPTELSEAAWVDGANSWQEFWYVTFPLLKRISLLAILLRTVDIWKVFDTIFVLTKGGPGTATQTLNFYAYLQSFQWFHLGYGGAIMVVGVAVILIFANVFLKFEGGLLEVE
jgi:multiple sugar transport system permease protein